MIAVHWKGETRLLSVDEATALHTALSAAICRHNTTAESVISIVADEFRVTRAYMAGDRRHQPIAYARQVAMYLLREITDLTLVEIGSLFPKDNGKPRDHGTVIHAWKLVHNRYLTEEFVRDQIKDITKRARKIPGTK